MRLRDGGDHRAWRQFVDVYATLVYGYARKQGLQDADAADLTQDVLRSIAGAIGRLDYDPARGSFRGWIFTVVRNKVRNFHADRNRREQASGESSVQERLEAQPDRDSADAADWEREYEQHLFNRAAELVKNSFQDSTWQAFWHTAVQGDPPEAAARKLGMSVGAVYIAKSRVLSQLREQVKLLQGDES
jgi:RNA polymerase sigma-70 factor (ECF subfamily)